MNQRYTIDTEEEADGRWIAEVPELAGCLVYGASRKQAAAKAVALALHILADRIENGEIQADEISRGFEIAA